MAPSYPSRPSSSKSKAANKAVKSASRKVPQSKVVENAQFQMKLSLPATAKSGPEGSNLAEVDKLFNLAGLARHRRSKIAGLPVPTRFPSATPDDLRIPPRQPNIAPNGVQYIALPGWNKYGWLWHGFSTRLGGVSSCYGLEGAPGELNLGFTADDQRELVLRNRSLLAEAITGSASTPLITVRQIHSSVLVVASASGGQALKGDGLMTDEPGLLLGIQTADCLPVLLADRKRRVVAAFHAGWRGTVKRIVESGVGRMRLAYGSRPEDLVAAIGPGIGACCYAIGDEVISSFESQFTYADELFHEVYETDSVRTKYPMLFMTQRAPGHSPIGPRLHLDLFEANRRQLLAAGLKPQSIKIVGGCTNCQRNVFFSHRGSNGRCGRTMSVIGIGSR